MKKLLLAILLLFPCIVHGQVQKERRVYYVDCSFSMVQNNLWNPVRENLKNAIDNISDETTEIVVVPFAFDSSHHSNLKASVQLATPSGKEALKKMIDNLPMSKSTMTYHSDPLLDFYSSRVNDDRVTYNFLMTDGQNEERPVKFNGLLKEWGKRFGEKNVYGFFVMLDNAARNKDVEDIINSQPHLWKVETADVNINLVRLGTTAIYNARNDKYFDVPLNGNIKGKEFKASFPKDSKYHVKQSKVENGKLRVYVTFDGDVYSLPASTNQNLSVSMLGGGKFDFLVTENVKVKCESKPERSLKVSIK